MNRPSISARILLAGQIASTLAISAGAAYLSFLSIRALAEFFGLNPATAWMIMPLIELFLLAGTFETALRILEGDTRRLASPRALTLGALLVTLVCNVAEHLLELYYPAPALAEGARWTLREAARLGVDRVEPWQAVALALFAALVPVAQILSLHLLVGRLRRMAERAPAKAKPAPRSVPRAGLRPVVAAWWSRRPGQRISGVPEAPVPVGPRRKLVPALLTAPFADPVLEGTFVWYAERLDAGEAEPNGEEIAAQLGHAHPGTGRKVRAARLRPRYATTVALGERAAPNSAPEEIHQAIGEALALAEGVRAVGAEVPAQPAAPPVELVAA